MVMSIGRTFAAFPKIITMRKLVFQEFLSLDGYAADKNHSTKFFEDRIYAVGSDADMLEEMQRFDTILLGANTYKMFVNFWPDADPKEQIVADKLNSIPKIVFSNSLKEAPWGKWKPAEIVSSDAAAKIRELKKEKGRDMVLWGSISLAQYLMKSDLIDEYQFRIVPVILGGGTLLFKEGEQHDLKLTKSKSYDSGLLMANYRPR
jgi:dihydrofolate reductase